MAGTGGKRPGAGRKSNEQKLLDRKVAISAISGWLTLDLQKSIWKELIADPDPQIRFKALAYLTDQVLGKAQQGLLIDGKLDVIKRVVADL